MTPESDRTSFERELAAALQHEEGAYTADCLDPSALMALIENESVSDRPDQIAHLAECPFCRKAYAEMQQELRIAAAAREIQAQREGHGGERPGGRLRLEEGAPAGSVRPSAGSFDPPTVLHFDLARMAATSTLSPSEAVGIFCGGALRVTLWLDGDEVVLTADNDLNGVWTLDESGALRLAPGEGFSLAGQLIGYEVTTPEGSLEGFLVLPETRAGAAAEITLGVQRDLLTGELACQARVPGDLKDVEAVRHSVARTRDRTSLHAWRSYGARHAEDLSPEVREAIAQSASVK